MLSDILFGKAIHYKLLHQVTTKMVMIDVKYSDWDKANLTEGAFYHKYNRNMFGSFFRKGLSTLDITNIICFMQIFISA